MVFGAMLSACEKATVEKEIEMEKEMAPIPVENIISEGSFTGASGHTTTGKVQVVKMDDGSRSIVFTDFKTDNGPDLKIYIAEDKNAKNFFQFEAEVANGSKTLVLPSSVDLEKQKFVLIWCKAFSVSFGYAELKTP